MTTPASRSGWRNLGIFIDVSAESAKLIVAEINRERIAELLAPDMGKALSALILKTRKTSSKW